MPRKKQSQSDKFKEAARDLGADQDETAFEERLRRIVPKKLKKAEKTPDK